MKPCFSESLNIQQDGVVIFFQKIIAHWYRKGDFDGDALWQTAKKHGWICQNLHYMHGIILSMHYVGPTALVHCVDVDFTRHSFTM